MKTLAEKYARKIYSGMKKEVREEVYPGEIPQMLTVYTALAEVFYPSLAIDTLSAVHIEYLQRFHINVYAQKAFRTLVFASDEKTTNEVIIRRHPEFSTEIVLAAANVSMSFFYDIFPGLKEKVSYLRARDQMIAEGAERTRGTEELHTDDPDYGLVPNKPIFTAGVKAEYEYADRLISDDGRELKYERIGTYDADGVGALVDGFDFSYDDGSPKCMVYLCMYSTKTSEKAPLGFKLRD